MQVFFHQFYLSFLERIVDIEIYRLSDKMIGSVSGKASVWLRSLAWPFTWSQQTLLSIFINVLPSSCKFPFIYLYLKYFLCIYSSIQLNLEYFYNWMVYLSHSLSLSLLFFESDLSLQVLCTFNLWIKANVLGILPFFSMNTFIFQFMVKWLCKHLKWWAIC